MPAKKPAKFPTIPILLAVIGLLVILFFYKERLFPQKETSQTQKELTCPKDYTIYKDSDFAFCYPQFLGEVYRKTVYEETNPNLPLLSHHPAYEKLTFSSYPVAYDVSSGVPVINIFDAQEVKEFEFENFAEYNKTAEDLETLLSEKDKVELLRQSRLPVLPAVVMAGQVFHARQEFLKGPQFDGLTFITAFAQDIYLADNVLIYIGKVGGKIVCGQFPLQVAFQAEYQQKISEAYSADIEGAMAKRLLTEYEQKLVDRQSTTDVSPHPEKLDKIFESFQVLP